MADELTAPPPWQQVEEHPSFKEQTPQEKLVSFSRWHDAAYNFAKTLPDWKEKEDVFNTQMSEQQTALSHAAGGIDPTAARVQIATEAIDKARAAEATFPGVEIDPNRSPQEKARDVLRPLGHDVFQSYLNAHPLPPLPQNPDALPPSDPKVESISASPTILGEAAKGNLITAATMAYKDVRDNLRPFFGASERQKVAESIPWGKNPDGTTHFEYRPLGGGPDEEGLIPGIMKMAMVNPEMVARAAGVDADKLLYYPHDAEDSTGTMVAKGTFNAAQGLLQTFLSPAVLMGFGGASPAAQKWISGGFALDMGSKIGPEIQAANNANNPQDFVQNLLGAATSIAFAGKAGEHSFKLGRQPLSDKDIAENVGDLSDPVIQIAASSPEFAEANPTVATAVKAELDKRGLQPARPSEVLSNGAEAPKAATEATAIIDEGANRVQELEATGSPLTAKVAAEQVNVEAAEVAKAPAPVDQSPLPENVLAQGELTKTHKDLADDIIKNLDTPPEDLTAAIEAGTNDKLHWFMTSEGKVIDRKQAADVAYKAGQIKPEFEHLYEFGEGSLQSQHLKEATEEGRVKITGPALLKEVAKVPVAETAPVAEESFRPQKENESGVDYTARKLAYNLKNGIRESEAPVVEAKPVLSEKPTSIPDKPTTAVDTQLGVAEGVKPSTKPAPVKLERLPTVNENGVIKPAWTNDPLTVAHQIDAGAIDTSPGGKGNRLYIPEEVMEADPAVLDPRIEFATEKQPDGSFKDYVTGVNHDKYGKITEQGQYSERYKNDKEVRERREAQTKGKEFQLTQEREAFGKKLDALAPYEKEGELVGAFIKSTLDPYLKSRGRGDDALNTTLTDRIRDAAIQEATYRLRKDGAIKSPKSIIDSIEKSLTANIENQQSFDKMVEEGDPIAKELADSPYEQISAIHFGPLPEAAEARLNVKGGEPVTTPEAKAHLKEINRLGLLEPTDGRGILQKLSESGTEGIKLISKALLDSKVDLSKLTFRIFNDPKSDAAASYMPNIKDISRGEIAINLGRVQNIESSLLHEIGHHFTMAKLEKGYERNAVEQAAYDGIHQAYDTVARDVFKSEFGRAPKNEAEFNKFKADTAKGDGNSNYWISDVHEFVQALYADPGAMGVVATHPEIAGAPKAGKFKGLLDNIKAWLNELFVGYQVKPETLLNNALNDALTLATETPLEHGKANVEDIKKLVYESKALPPSPTPDSVKTSNWFKDTVRRLFTAEGNLPKEVFERWQLREGDTKTAGRAATYVLRDLYNAVQKEFGIGNIRRGLSGLDKVPPEFVKKMNDALLDDTLMGAIPEGVRGPLEQMRAQIDAFSRKMIDEGLAQGDLEAKFEENLGVYLTRSYKAFDNKNWPKQVPIETRNKAEALILDQLRKNNPEATTADAAREVDAMLQDWKDRGDQRGLGGTAGKNLGSMDLSIFKKRGDIDPIIRELMGEYHDPAINFTRSVAKMSSLLANARFLNDVKAKGLGKFMFEDGKQPEGYTSKIAAEGTATMAPLNGLRTTPEIAEAFKEFNKVTSPDNPVFRTYMKMVSIAKGSKTVGSIMTQVRNAQQFWFAAMNGHYDVRALKDALMATGADIGLTNDVKWRDFYKEMLRLNVVNQSTKAGELRDTLREAMLPEVDRSEFSTGKAVKRAAGGLLGASTRSYQIPDDAGKMFGFINERNRQAKQHPEWTEEEVKQEAARRVRLTYPSYSMVPEAIKKLRRLPIGPFMTFSYEQLRTTFHNLRFTSEAINEARKATDPAIRKAYTMEAGQRLAGQLAVLGGAGLGASLLSAWTLGITAQEEEDARKFLPPWDENAQLVFTGKEKGKLKYINMSYQNPYSGVTDPIGAVIRGVGNNKSSVEVLGGAVAEFLQPFVSNDILAGKILEFKANKKQSNGNPVYNESDTPDQIAKDVLLHFYEGFEPGTATRFRNKMLPAARGETRQGQQLSLQREIVSEFTGLKQQELNYESNIGFKASDFARGDLQRSAIFRSVALREGNVTSDDIQKAYVRAEGQRFKEWKKLHEIAMAGVRSGLTTAQIVTIMTGRGRIPKSDISAIVGGKYIPDTLSKDAQKRMLQMKRTVPKLVSPYRGRSLIGDEEKPATPAPAAP